MLFAKILAVCLAVSVGDDAVRPSPVEPTARVFKVQQTVTLAQIEVDAKVVRWWISIPDNQQHQDLLDISIVKAPGQWRIERDAVRGHRFLYVEVEKPGVTQLDAVVEYTLRRESVHEVIRPENVGPITVQHAQFYAEELRKDAPHMQVDAAAQALADRVCGDEQNPAIEVAQLLRHVASSVDHYSKDPTKPKCGIGSVTDCLTNGGGCCTDLHSLFITLARARGIPSRMQMGYRFNPKNEGKDYDPGYRCWVEYFLPGYGWVSADIVEADAPEGLGPNRWFTGLTEWRVWLNEGREFQLRPSQASGPVNTMIIGHAEIDGRPARVLPVGELPAQLSRTIRFNEVR
jgi:hypothetical protein